jgi:hypothetical protein
MHDRRAPYLGLGCSSGNPAHQRTRAFSSPNRFWTTTILAGVAFESAELCFIVKNRWPSGDSSYGAGAMASHTSRTRPHKRSGSNQSRPLMPGGVDVRQSGRVGQQPTATHADT